MFRATTSHPRCQTPSNAPESASNYISSIAVKYIIQRALTNNLRACQLLIKFIAGFHRASHQNGIRCLPVHYCFARMLTGLQEAERILDL